ncbi:MAG: hypothetical protein VX899_20210 [Myxococcota bacterium]|nr:hypothetical protein [Myxococcota bacterium]
MRTLELTSVERTPGLQCWTASARMGRSTGPDRAFTTAGLVSGISPRLALYTGLYWRLSAASVRVAWLGEGWSSVAGDGVVPIDARVDLSGRVLPAPGALRELGAPRELCELLAALPGEQPVLGLLALSADRLEELAHALMEHWPLVEVLDGDELLMLIQLARVPGELETLHVISPNPDLETDLELALVDLNAQLIALEEAGGSGALWRLMRGSGL